MKVPKHVDNSVPAKFKEEQLFDLSSRRQAQKKINPNLSVEDEATYYSRANSIENS